MIDNSTVGEIVLYGVGGLFTLGVTTTVSTWVAMQVKQRYDVKKAESYWNGDKVDRRTEKYNSKLEQHETEIAVIKNRLDNILDMLHDIRHEIRNGNSCKYDEISGRDK